MEKRQVQALVLDTEPWLKSAENNAWEVWANTYRDGKRTGYASIPLDWFEVTPEIVAS